MKGTRRAEVIPGKSVLIVLKKDQHSGKLTQGIVKDVLTNSQNHHHGIKVRLVDGKIGRVKQIMKS
ncbi:MAG: YwbE family protein [Candidatus Lokiarchaeota archaeon]|nr:YwbE family protein [Candidatus Lokiarchaeota archaeon]